MRCWGISELAPTSDSDFFAAIRLGKLRGPFQDCPPESQSQWNITNEPHPTQPTLFPWENGIGIRRLVLLEQNLLSVITICGTGNFDFDALDIDCR
jgi:hypothetical protein